MEKDDMQQCLAEVSSGEVIISGPAEESSGKGAVLTPGEGVILRVNGQEVEGSCRVCPRDKVEISTLQQREPAQVKVEIDAKKMTAEAVYISPREISYLISDHEPSPELTVTAVRTEERAAPETDLSLDEIKNILKDNGVLYGLDESALPGLITGAGRRQVVAVGRPPVQGRDGYVEFLFKEGLQQVRYDQSETRVDYRKRYEIPQVEKDQVIARIHPPRPGEPGMTVTGEEISPEQVYPVKLRCETGTALSAGQTEVVATGNGVPVYRRQGAQVLIRVDHIYRYPGNVNVKSGHIDFEGHLKIEGGIEEGLRVKADGNIEVADNASGAEIIAGGSIIFKKNCIKCQAQAGWLALRTEEFNRVCAELTDHIKLALDLGRELLQALPERGAYSDVQVNILLRSLIQKKIPVLPEESSRADQLSRELTRMLPDSLKEALQGCHLFLQGSGQLFTLAKLQQLHEALCRGRERWSMADPGDNAATISVHYVQNSSLTCPGDIHVHGPGAYNSLFTCGGQVHVKRIFRGGSIKAGGNIYIGEAGVPRLTEMQGLIETAAQAQVYLGRVYENTRIKIGKPELCLEKDLKDVMIYQDQEGNIRISRWKK